VLWLVLLAFVIAIPVLLLWLYWWASDDPGVEREIASRRFQEIHELRGLRRSGYVDATPIREGTTVKDYDESGDPRARNAPLLPARKSV